MKKILMICAAMMALSVSAQVHIQGASQTSDTTARQLSILFNNQQSPSQLLKESGTYRLRAIETALVGGAVGGIMMSIKEPESTAESSTNWQLLGAGVITASAIVALIFEGISASKEKQAGEQMERISISLGGISYHF